MQKRLILLTILFIFVWWRAAFADDSLAHDHGTQFVDLCQKLLTSANKDSDSQLRSLLEDNFIAKSTFLAAAPGERLSATRILNIKNSVANLPLPDQMEVLRAYLTLSLREFDFLPAPDQVANYLTVLYSSKTPIDQIFAKGFNNETTEEIIAMIGINRLRHLGVEFDIEKGTIERSSKVVHEYEENVNAFLNKTDFVREDWKLGQAMPFPGQSSWKFWQKSPSEFARLKMVNRDGKAYFTMKAWNPENGNFEVHDYPVVKLSESGNPVLLIHPRSHLLIPTEPVVPNVDKYDQSGKSMAKVTANKPVPLTIYYGFKHLGMFEQLIVRSDGNMLAYAAWRRHQPMFVEITDGAEYRPVAWTWGTVRTSN